MQVRKKPFEGCKQAGGAVDREHPQGSITGKTQIPAPKGVQRCEQDLHAPAAQPAQEKAPAEGFKKEFAKDFVIFMDIVYEIFSV